MKFASIDFRRRRKKCFFSDIEFINCLKTRATTINSVKINTLTKTNSLLVTSYFFYIVCICRSALLFVYKNVTT